MAFKCLALCSLALVSFFLTVTPVISAPWDHSSRLSRAIKKYDQKKVRTVKGEVKKVYEKIPSFGKKKKDALGFHVKLESEGEMYEVHIGPVWYFRSMDGVLAAGDLVEVVGAVKQGKPKPDGTFKPYDVRAREIIKGGEVVVLARDAHGRPVWSGVVSSNE